MHFTSKVSNFEMLDTFDAKKVSCNFENKSQKLYLSAAYKIDKVELFNILGQSVASQMVSERFLEMNLTGLNAGPYYGKVFFNNNSHVFVIRK